MADEMPDGPWTIFEAVTESMKTGFIGIRGPANEKICDIFPWAGKGGVGLLAARAIAKLIIEARNKP